MSIERTGCDRVLHEARTARPDPLRLALVFGPVPHDSGKYTLIACGLLDGQPAEAAGAEH